MYHAGQLAVQRRAGGSEVAARLARGMRAELPEVARDFIAERELLLIAAADDDGRVWCSPLQGEEGFAQAIDERTLAIAARPGDGDPLAAPLARPAPVGLLAIDPLTRRRMRVNGRAEPSADGLIVRAEQVFSNCPKYIQRRAGAPARDGTRRVVRAGDGLTAADRALIAAADTFFIATSGPDASHRGGSPGFVAVDGDALSFPDYTGNSMFMTLGNIATDPAAGLLFVDWKSGATLQVSGRAAIDWSPERAAELPGAERVVDLRVERVVATAHALPARWALLERSRFNPPVNVPITTV